MDGGVDRWVLQYHQDRTAYEQMYCLNIVGYSAGCRHFARSKNLQGDNVRMKLAGQAGGFQKVCLLTSLG
jgi:hypothetical protein